MTSHTVKIQIGRHDQAFFKYIIESYENLATVSTLEPNDCILEVYIPSGNHKIMKNLISNLKNELKFQILENKSIENN